MDLTIITTVVTSLLLQHRFPSAADKTAGLFGVHTTWISKRANVAFYLAQIQISFPVDSFKTELYSHKLSNIFMTKPKLPYGRQGLAGLWGKDARINSLLIVLSIAQLKTI